MTNLVLSRNLFAPYALKYIRDYSHRWEVWMGSAGSAKSYSITQKLIYRALSENLRILVCRRYATTIRQTVFALFKEVLTKWKIITEVKINESDYRIAFPNGSEILFCGLDDETKLLSLTNISTVWVEEVWECSKDIVEQLNLRMRGKASNQQLILSFNPISKNHWLYNFCEENPPESFLYIRSTYKDNPFLNKEYVASLEELYTRNPQKAKIFCDGEWGVNADGLVYNNWKVEQFDYKEKNGSLACGLDFGFSTDPTAFVASIVDEDNKEIYIFKEWYKTNQTNDDIAKAITSLGFSKSEIVCDSAEPKSIEELKRSGLYRVRASVKGPDSILFGIQKLQQYRIIIHPDCINILNEFENYTWKKDRLSNNYEDKPIDNFNHLLDALRYSIQAINKGQLKSISKSLLGI